jgi:hypothetical protein
MEVAWLGTGRMVSTSDALWFDNPQARLNALRRQRTNRAIEAL